MDFVACALGLGLQFGASMANLAIVKMLEVRFAPPWNQVEGFAVNFAILILISPLALLGPALFDHSNGGGEKLADPTSPRWPPCRQSPAASTCLRQVWRPTGSPHWAT